MLYICNKIVRVQCAKRECEKCENEWAQFVLHENSIARQLLRETNFKQETTRSVSLISTALTTPSGRNGSSHYDPTFLRYLLLLGLSE